jgi:hypothetical protein
MTEEIAGGCGVRFPADEGWEKTIGPIGQIV